ncbi:histidine phosphatase family protein [Sulfuricurvum sp.]|uniref:histidine phosphatase family protein n=1 Tax=Sulfuricurvum sp. TaxID=2025608 RepID=UPI00286DD04D|nr:histidine phosphatase family protein [Sulfuricurvum sp.]
MPLTLLRHAAPAVEYHGRTIGHTDISIDLTLFNAITLPLPYDAIYSSDLRRCTQTLEHLGYTDIITDPRLREVAFKKQFEGKRFDEIEQMEAYHPSFLESQESWHTFLCEESREHFRRRIETFLGELPLHKNILVCSHGGTIREILSLLKSEPKSLGYLEYTIVTVK